MAASLQLTAIAASVSLRKQMFPGTPVRAGGYGCNACSCFKSGVKAGTFAENAIVPALNLFYTARTRG